jgi:hypothetical protein
MDQSVVSAMQNILLPSLEKVMHGIMEHQAHTEQAILRALSPVKPLPKPTKPVDKPVDYNRVFIQVLATRQESSLVQLLTTMPLRTIFPESGVTLLSQPLILALMHQLAPYTLHVAAEHYELMLEWLGYSLLFLHTQDTSIQVHVAHVLAQLQQHAKQAYYTSLATHDHYSKKLAALLRKLDDMLSEIQQLVVHQ